MLEEMSFAIEPIPGRENDFSTALSQYPATQPAVEPRGEKDMVPPKPSRISGDPPPELFSIYTENLVERVINEQQTDRQIEAIAAALDPAKPDASHRYYAGGIWRRGHDRWVLLAPQTSREAILHEYHDSALASHPGMDETLRAVQERFSWDKMRSDVREHVRNCRLCASTEATRPDVRTNSGRIGLPAPGKRSPSTLWARIPGPVGGNASSWS